MNLNKGLIQDTQEVNQPEGSWRYLRNGVDNMKIGNLSTELGNREYAALPTGKQILCAHLIDEGRKIVFLSGDPDEIGIIDSVGVYTALRIDSDMDFNRGTTFDVDYWVNYCGETIVYYTDNYNHPRFINVDNPSSLSIDYSNIFPFYNGAPKIDLEALRDYGGGLLTGSYYIAVALVAHDGAQTDFVTISEAIYVGNESKSSGPDSYDGAEAEFRTSKSIAIKISNIDTNYEKLRIAYIPSYAGVVGPALQISDINIQSAEHRVNITGQEGTTELALEDVIIQSPRYRTAKALRIYNKRTYLANLSEEIDIGAQPHVNGLIIREVHKKINNDMTGSGLAYRAKSDINSFYFKSYKSNEVYSFYIQFILKDGTLTKAYHIPGRDAIDNPFYGAPERNTVDALIAPDYTNKGTQLSSLATGPGGNTTVKAYQIFGRAGGGLMAFWENEHETYDDNDNWLVKDSSGVVTDDLRNRNVRHHKFTDNDSRSYWDGSDMYVRGFKISNFLSQMPQSIIDQIQAYRIFYAKRTPENSTKLSQAIALQVVQTQNGQGPVPVQSPLNYLPRRNQFPLQNQQPLYQNTFEVRADQYMPFDAMQDSSLFMSAGYVENIFLYRAEGMDFGSTSNRREFLRYRKQESFSIGNYGRVIKGKALLPFTNSNNVLRTTDAGLTAGTYGFYRKSAFIAEFELDTDPYMSALDELGFSPPSNSPGIGLPTSAIPLKYVQSGAFLQDICAYKKNVYQNFAAQELVWTGYTQTDLTVTESDEIYGGDIFINNYAFQQTVDAGVLGASILGAQNPGYWDSDTDKSGCIHEVVVESRFNAGMRHNGSANDEVYYPKTDMEAVLNTSRDLDQWWGYNPDYHAAATLYQPEVFYNDECRIKYPTRIHRGFAQYQEDEIDQLRIFRSGDYMTLPLNRGSVQNLLIYDNILLPILKRAAVFTKGNERMKIGTSEAFVGTGDIFAVEPDELITTEEGFAGTQGIYGSVESQAGIFWADVDAGRVYMFRKGIEEISDAGMRNFFLDNLPFELSKYGVSSDLPAKGHGIDMVWDPKYKRMIMSKEEWKPRENLLALLESGWQWDEEALQFVNPDKNSRPYSIDFADYEYMEHSRWTLSFNPQKKLWISFHDYSALFAYNDLETFFTPGNPPNLTAQYYWKHNAGPTGEFYGKKYPFEIEVIQPTPNTNTVLSSVAINSNVEDSSGNDKNFDFFKRYVGFNSYQCTGYEDITNRKNARVRDREWKINGFRDFVINPEGTVYTGHEPEAGNIDTAKPWHKKAKMHDRWHGIKLIYPNTDNNSLHLYSIDFNLRKAVTDV